MEFVHTFQEVRVEGALDVPDLVLEGLGQEFGGLDADFFAIEVQPFGDYGSRRA